MRVDQVTCPACRTPVFTKSLDLIVQCDRCGELHLRGAVPQIVKYQVGELPVHGAGEIVYFPVWSMDVVFHIDNIENKSDLLFLYEEPDSGVKKEGKLRLFLPAHSLNPSLVWHMASSLKEKCPAVGPKRLDPKVRRLPCIIDTSMAEKLAHFLFIAEVTDPRGALHRLDYRLTVINIRLLYLSGSASLIDGYPADHAGPY